MYNLPLFPVILVVLMFMAFPVMFWLNIKNHEKYFKPMRFFVLTWTVLFSFSIGWKLGLMALVMNLGFLVSDLFKKNSGKSAR
jgi:hypothetical protein